MVSWRKVFAIMLVSLFLMGLFTISPVVTVNAAPTWNIQIIDKNATGGGDIVLDSYGRPQILYAAYQDGNYSNPFVQLMYANWTGSVWSIRALALFYGFYNFVLDSNNFPQILCRDGAYLIVWNGSNWSKQIVTSDDVSQGSLALDSAGNPHVAYTTDYGSSANPVSLKYASWTGTNWSIQTVGTFKGIYNRIYLALDSNNNPQIMYGNDTGYSLPPPNGGEVALWAIKFAIWNSSTWNIQTAISNVSAYGNMVLDSKGYPHFTYKKDYPVTYGNSTLYYASWNGSAWNSQPVISKTDFDLGYLTLDTYDYPHMDFSNNTSSALMYAQWTGTLWDIQTVGQNGFGIESGPIVVDSVGNAYVTYSGHVDMSWRIGYGGYASATEPVYTPTPSPTPTATNAANALSTALMSWTTIVAISVVSVFAVFVFLLRRHRKTQKE